MKLKVGDSVMFNLKLAGNYLNRYPDCIGKVGRVTNRSDEDYSVYYSVNENDTSMLSVKFGEKSVTACAYRFILAKEVITGVLEVGDLV